MADSPSKDTKDRRIMDEKKEEKKDVCIPAPVITKSTEPPESGMILVTPDGKTLHPSATFDKKK